jgi:hypothetical protein
MSFYRTGTIGLTNGSTAVTGVGTDFYAGSAVGECLQAPDGKLYEISAIGSATSLTLGQVYLGSTASGQSYSIVPTQSYIRDLANQAAALVNGFANAVVTQTHAATGKTTPVDADELALVDSAASFTLKKLTWANLKATIKTYLSGVSFPIGSTTPSTGAFTTLSATQDFSLAGNKSLKLGAASYVFSDGNGAVEISSTGAAPEVNTVVGGALKTKVSATGLAITGALSATGKANFGGSSSTEALAVKTGNASTYMSLETATEAGVHVGNNGGALVLLTGTAERARIDTSGNLGIGVVPGAWGGSGLLCLSAGSAVAFQGPAGSIVTNAYYNSGWKYAIAGAATWVNQTAGGYQWHTAPSGTAGAAITFTQAMTLDASGNLLGGGMTTAAGYGNGWLLGPTVGGALSPALSIGHLTGAASGALYAGFGYNGAGIGSITQSGTTAVAYNTTSDHRLKENVRPANATRFGDIEFVDFEWVDGRHDCGVIAHQLQSVYPDLVLGEKDATEVRTVEITPAVPAVTEQVLVTPAVDAVAEVLGEDGNVTQEAVAAVEAVYETVEVTPAVPAVTEDQTFPVYQQVNYMGLIGRMGTTIQKQQSLIEAMEARLSALEAA